jgi:hypothetical protein
VYVYLSGDDSAIGTFLHRLRTENVDVDRAGRPCRERMATVLCRRRRPDRAPVAASTEGGRHGATAPPAAGWEVEEYAGEHGLERALDALGVLHVGVGSSRFGA